MVVAIPRKATDRVNISAPVAKYIEGHYGKQSKAEHTADIQLINQTRENFLNAYAQSDPNEIEERCLSWHSIIARLETTFPFRANTAGMFAKANSIAIKFVWYDALNPKKPVKDFCLGLEKASILYNYAAYLTDLACKMSARDDDDNRFKITSNLMCTAAGVFDYLSRSAELGTAGHTEDLSRNTLSFFSAFCLAQGQEGIARHAIFKNASASLNAKLCKSTAEFFEEAKKLAQADSNLRKLLENSSAKNFLWISYIDHQKAFFSALAEMFDAQNTMTRMNENKSIDTEYPYGYEIARLQKANQLLNQANTYAKRCRGLAGAQTAEVAKYHRKIAERLKEAETDNHQIYHDRVPSGPDLSVVPMKQAVKLLPFQPRQPARHLFTNLVPAQITELNNKVRTQCRQQYHEALTTSKEATSTGHAVLASLGLPAAVECANAEDSGKPGLPDKTWERIFMISAEGGIQQLQERFQMLHEAETHVQSLIADVNKQLEREYLEDSTYRAQYGQRWTRNTSETGNAKYRADLATAMNYLTEGASGNTNLDAEFAKNVDSFTTLSFNRDELESQMPQESPSQPKQLNEHGQALITQLDLLNTLLETRAQLQDKYLEQVTGLDMTNMLLAGNQKFEAVIEQAKSKLEDIDNELKTNVMGQSDILEVIQETFQKFDASRGGANANDPKTQYVHNLNETCKKFESLSSDVNARIAFYQDLQETFLAPMKQNVFDWAFARSEEAKIHVQSLGGEPIDIDAFDRPQTQAKDPTMAPIVQPMQAQPFPITPPQPAMQPPLNQQGSVNAANPWANPAMMSGVQAPYMPGYTPVVINTYPNGHQQVASPLAPMMPMPNQQMMNQGIPMQNQQMQNQQMQTQQALLQQQMLMQQQALQQQQAAMQANSQNPFAPAPAGGWPMGGPNQQQYQQPQYAYAQPATNPHANASAPQFGVTPQQYYQQNQPPNPNS